MVVIYHLFPSALPGGFLGVDVFFAISGFLITSLLLREYRSTGRINLLDFWRRRARRLLPAVALVVLVSTSLSLAASRDLLVGIAAQLAGAVFFVTNWVFIARGSDYFTRDAPELFRNFWSLALEEQFYILLPIFALLAFRYRTHLGRIITGTVLTLLGVLSAWHMAALALGDADASRIYFGSDSHSFGLLFGAALAVLIEHRAGRELSRSGQVWSIGVTVAGFAVIAYFTATLVEASRWSFTGGFQIATIAALAVVWAVTREGSWAGRALDIAPLRWIGERSYGIYLWHWPLLVIMTNLSTGFGKGWAPQLITLVLTLLSAALAYRFVEQPIRQLGLRGAFRQWLSPRSYTPRQRRVAIGITAVLAVAFPLTGVAVAIAPERTTSAEHILRGQQKMEQEATQESNADGSADADGAPAEGASDGADGDGASSAGTPEDAAEGTPVPEPVTIDGRDITAIGDSVMLASYPELSEAFPGIEVDAAVSRGLWAGVEIAEQLDANGQLRSVIVVGLGTNGPVDDEALARLKEIAGPRPIVLVDAYGERDWIPPVNEQLDAFARHHRGVTLAHWSTLIDQEPEALAGDGIHPGSRGGEIYAQAVQLALDELDDAGEGVGWGLPRR